MQHQVRLRSRHASPGPLPAAGSQAFGVAAAAQAGGRARHRAVPARRGCGAEHIYEDTAETGRPGPLSRRGWAIFTPALRRRQVHAADRHRGSIVGPELTSVASTSPAR